METEKIEGVVAVPYQYRHDRLCFLLLHQIKPRCWELPKGGRDGKDIKQAMIDELLEEANIQRSMPRPLMYKGKQYTYTYSFDGKSGNRIERLMYVFYVKVGRSEEIRVNDVEHDYFEWFGYKKASSHLRHQSMRRALTITERLI